MRVCCWRRRREWHERIARALEERFPELTANEPELLAHHFGEAGLAGPACDYRMRAGDRALSRSAYQEAIAHFSAGLKLAERLPEPADRMRRQLDFLLKLGPALMVARGHAERGGRGCLPPRQRDRRSDRRRCSASFKAKWGLWLNANIRRKTALARDRASELVTLAQRSGDGDLLLEAYHCRWSTAFFRGDVAAALDDSRIGVETYDMARHRHLGQAFGGHDPGVCAHVVLRSWRCNCPAIESRRRRASRTGLRSPKRSTIPTASPMRSTMSPLAISSSAIATRHSRPPTAQRRLAEKFGLLPRGVPAACCSRPGRPRSGRASPRRRD